MIWRSPIFDGLCKCTDGYGTQGKFGELFAFCILRFPGAHVIQAYLRLSGFLAFFLLFKTEISISKAQLYVLSQTKVLQRSLTESNSDSLYPRQISRPIPSEFLQAKLENITKAFTYTLFSILTLINYRTVSLHEIWLLNCTTFF